MQTFWMWLLAATSQVVDKQVRGSEIVFVTAIIENVNLLMLFLRRYLHTLILHDS